jgi:hypothetical protein
MLAFNALTINLDSYSGAFAQNYYLYEDKTGLFNPVVWDLNMCFGGFPFLGSSNTSLASLSIPVMKTLPLDVHASDQYWPLIKAVHANSTYRKMFYAHAKTITEEYFTNGNYVTKYNEFKNTVDTAVLKDAKKFYSYAQFQNALTSDISIGTYSVPGLQTLMDARVNYLQTTPAFSLSAPSIKNPAHSLQNAIALITASVTGAAPGSVYLGYRLLASNNFTRIAMFDDGAHNDGSPNDGLYGCSFKLTGNHAQYYIYAENADAGIFSPQRAEHEFYNIDIYKHPLPGQVVINELLAYNKSDVKNEFHVNEDWIELFNNSSETLSLDGYFLSDSYSTKAKFMLPASATIAPHSFLTVWADEFPGGSDIHCNFKLSENGDALVLSNGLRSVIDGTDFGVQEKDVSLARCPDGTGAFFSNALPSFGMSNCIVGIDEQTFLPSTLSVFPVPANDIITVRSGTQRNEELCVLNITGQIILTENVIFEKTIDCSAWSPGVYFAKCGTAVQKIIIE